MTTEAKTPSEAASVAERAVREYLLFLDDPQQLVDTAEIERLESAANATSDPLERLRLMSQLERARQPGGQALRDRFVEHAKAWADANEVTIAAFQELGVDRGVLRDAGLLSRRGRARSTTGSSRTVTVDELKTAARRRDGVFTFADLADEVGGSQMTIRKAIDELIEAGEVERLGPAPDWHQKGRAPIQFRRH